MFCAVEALRKTAQIDVAIRDMSYTGHKDNYKTNYDKKFEKC